MRIGIETNNVVECAQEACSLTTRWLRDHNLRGLHCGSGRNLQPNCLNTDCCQLVDADGQPTEPGKIALCDGRYFLQHDATTPFPIEDASFNWVYSEHFIEHIPLEAAVAWLKEVRRLLRPGGFARISTPDLAKYMAGYVDPQATFFAEHRNRLQAMGIKNVPARRAWMVNQIFRHWGHQWLYDFVELSGLARAAGFDRIIRCRYREGRDSEVAGLDRAVRNDESLYVELVKE